MHSHNVCRHCHATIGKAVRQNQAVRISEESTDKRIERELPFGRLNGLRSRATHGCAVCGIFLNQYNSEWLLQQGNDRSGELAVELVPDDSHNDQSTLFFYEVKQGEGRFYKQVGYVHLARIPELVADASSIATMQGTMSAEQMRGSHRSLRHQEMLQFAQMWISECNKHEKCKRWPEVHGTAGFVPSRLVEIEGSTRDGSVRLVNGAETGSKGKVYATLSHCWGRRTFVRLLKSNERELRAKIYPSILSTTFRDAIELARDLGLSYIWIDALCIVQDDPDDWKREAAAMSAVYANSYINLAAAASSDSYGGLFMSDDRTFCQTVSVEVKLDTGDTETYMAFYDTFLQDVDSGPLATRAWVVQERFLAPRILQLGDAQAHWECLSMTSSQCLARPLELASYKANNLKRLRDDADYGKILTDIECLSKGSGTELVYRQWEILVQKYNMCLLTYASDRPIAILGIVAVISRLLGLDINTDYIHGLWRPRFIDGLSWTNWKRSQDPLQRADRVHHSVPTWSWQFVDAASCPLTGPRSRFGSEVDNLRRAIIAELISIDRVVIRNIERDACSLRGPLCPVRLCRNENTPMLRFGDMQTFNATQFQFVLDHDDVDLPVAGTEMQCYALLLRALSDRQVSKPDLRATGPAYGGDYECLLLRPVPAAAGYFERFGHARVCPRELGDYAKSLADAEAMYSALDAGFHVRRTIPHELYHSVSEDARYLITLI
jgi:hypothetical protein